ncbi:MAG: response regulator [Oscillospiraceae bacterium]|jgi:signal transduction histidine kinase/CheY-like chemotaxis protein|nr:response regulator [Oscillospiraceae bacterium]
MKTNNNKAKSKFSFVYALFFLSSTAMFIVAAIFTFLISDMESKTIASIQNHLLVAAQRASVFIPVEELDLFHTVEDMERPEWDDVRVRLQTFAEESHVLYVYYWRYIGDGLIQYIIDNDDDPEYMVTPELIFALEDDPFTEDAVPRIMAGESWVADLGVYTESWDSLISAVVPVFNDDGTIYCAAGVDLSDEVLVNMHNNIRIVRYALIISLVISVLSGFFGIRSYNKKAIQSANASFSKSHFLSSMSHEMRTPLNAIIGMTTIGKRAEDTDRKNRAFGKIEDASSHLLAVINNILDMAKIEADKLELSPVDFDFEKMLQKIITVVSFRSVEKQQKLTVNIDSSVPTYLYGDDHRLSQVITNLLTNAVKFTPEGGAISFSASLVGEVNNDCELHIEVADTGIGIAPEQQHKVFNMFEQAESGTTRKYGGTGLGLVISKQIVELMGGKIWIESVLGQGSRFVFNIKIRQSEKNHEIANEHHDTTTHTENIGHKSNKFADFNLLIVEDIEINREILIALLEDTGLIIDIATNGEEALNMIKTSPDKYDIIFMDVQMPVMDGLEATRRIRALPDRDRGRLPIIAMTANVFRDDIEDCYNAGMDDHLGKPLEIERIFEVLHNYLEARF